MKKIVLLLCLLLLVGCSKNEVNGGTNNSIGLANPMVERDSLDDVNNITHGHITKPGVPGVSEEKFFTIETEEGIIGQYDFVVNGNEYTIRFSDTIINNDISGIWIDGNPAFDDNLSNLRATGSGYKLARWFTVDGQYSFTAPDSIDDTTFENIVDELTSLSSPNGNN